MRKICLATILSMGLLAFSNVYAAPVCEYFEDVGFIYISGSAGSDYAYKTVNIMLKEQDNDTPDDDSIIYIADTKTDENGNYVYKFKIDLDGAPEDYYVHTRVSGQRGDETDLVEGQWLAVNLPQYDRQNNEISFSGLYKYESDDKDLRIIIKSGELGDVTDWDTEILFESEISVNENGLYNIVVDLIENDLTPGTYCFRIYDDMTGCEYEEEFEIYDIDSVLEDINEYIDDEDASGLLTCITSKADILGLDVWEIAEGVGIEDLTEDVLTLLINNDNNIADIGELQLEIQGAYATDLINNLDDEDYDGAREILFETFEDIFGIEQFSYYEQYEDLVEQELDEVVLDEICGKADGFKSFTEILDTLSEKTLITAINSTEFWNQIKDIVLANEDYFTIEDVPTKVWKKLSDEKPFDSISEFEEICAELEEENDKPSKKPSSSGGGITIVGRPETVTDEKEPENFQKPDEPVVEDKEDVTPATFNDVSKEHWAYDSVEYLYEKQIVNGIGENMFMPDETLKREELITMIVTAAELSPVEGETAFTDVDSDKWYAGYIGAAKENGITFGKDDGSFGVGEALTREDAAVLCYRAFIKDADASADSLEFNDKDNIADYAKQAVAKMVELGIINGKNDGTFAPKDYCTRAEVAVILHGILESISK